MIVDPLPEFVGFNGHLKAASDGGAIVMLLREDYSVLAIRSEPLNYPACRCIVRVPVIASRVSYD
jgi:hypothetical protein